VRMPSKLMSKSAFFHHKSEALGRLHHPTPGIAAARIASPHHYIVASYRPPLIHTAYYVSIKIPSVKMTKSVWRDPSSRESIGVVTQPSNHPTNPTPSVQSTKRPANQPTSQVMNRPIAAWPAHPFHLASTEYAARGRNANSLHHHPQIKRRKEHVPIL
jgi:hypothetical protein